MIKNISEARTTYPRKQSLALIQRSDSLQDSSISYDKSSREIGQDSMKHHHQQRQTFANFHSKLVGHLTGSHPQTDQLNIDSLSSRVRLNASQDNVKPSVYDNSNSNLDHYKTRKPNFNLGYSTSGRTIPRQQQVHKNHHFRSASMALVQAPSKASVKIVPQTRNAQPILHSQQMTKDLSRFKKSQLYQTAFKTMSNSSQQRVDKVRHAHKFKLSSGTNFTMATKSTAVIQSRAAHSMQTNDQQYVSMTEALIKRRMKEQEVMFLPQISQYQTLDVDNITVGSQHIHSREYKPAQTMSFQPGRTSVPVPLISSIASESSIISEEVQVKSLYHDFKQFEQTSKQRQNVSQLMAKTRTDSVKASLQVSQTVQSESKFEQQKQEEEKSATLTEHMKVVKQSDQHSRQSQKSQIFKSLTQQKWCAQGPAAKKFNVLASFKDGELKRQYQKHFKDSANPMQLYRLRQEFANIRSKNMKQIKQTLKPVAYFDRNRAMGQLSPSDLDGREGSNSGASLGDDAESSTSIEDIAPADHESTSMISSDESWDSFSGGKDLFEQTQAHHLTKQTMRPINNISELFKEVRQNLQQSKTKNHHPILPRGMTVKALYDGSRFKEWYANFVEDKPPCHEKQVERKMKRNVRQTRRRQRRELATKQSQGNTNSDDSVSLNSGDGPSSSSSSHQLPLNGLSRQNPLKRDVTLAETAKHKSLQKQLLNQHLFSLDDVYESDEELRDPQAVKNLVEQIGAEEENYTLHLPHEIVSTLELFKVIVIGSQEKRVNKRLRLTNHFFHQYFKLVRREINLAQISEATLRKNALNEISVDDLMAQDDKNNRPSIPDSNLKKHYELKLQMEERRVLEDLHKMGEAGLDSLRNLIQERAFGKLIDKNQEQQEWDLYEAKSKALRELLQPKGPSKESKDFQSSQQPETHLKQIELKPFKELSMSPQRGIVASHYGKMLIDQVSSRPQQISNTISNDIRLKPFGGAKSDAITQKIINAVQIFEAREAQELNSHWQAAFGKGDTPAKSDVSSYRFEDAVAAKREKLKALKHKLEVSEKHEVFEKSNLASQYFASLKKSSQQLDDRDVQINKDFSEFCVQREHVMDLPIFSHIKNNGLSLIGYYLNSGVCKAIGGYLAESNWRINKKFIIHELVLDDNHLKDEDFAEIISGLTIQAQLRQLTYARNSFDLESVLQLQKLVETQEQVKVKAHERLRQVSLIKVKTNPEVIFHLFQHVLIPMPYLTQLKLQGVSLARQSLTTAMITALNKHKNFLELLDLQDCQLSGKQLANITTALQDGFTELHSLNLSFNMAKEKDGRIQANILQLITKKSKLNHLNVGYMALGFDSCQSICNAASQSHNLCALHISGNQLSHTEQLFLLRTLGIAERELDTTGQQQGKSISFDEIRTLLEPKTGGRRASGNLSPTMTNEARQQFSNSKLFTKMVALDSQEPVIDKTSQKLTVQQIVGASVHQDNQSRISKSKSQLNGQSGQLCTPFANLVFTRQVYTPELCINQDTNRQNLLVDKSGPFTWHVNFKSDECYICLRWRYCLLFFSRKHVIESEFFTPIATKETRVSLDKICGFSKGGKSEGKQPWLIGTITALNKSQFVPIEQYESLLNWRLKNSRYLKASQQIDNAEMDCGIQNQQELHGKMNKRISKIVTQAELTQLESTVVGRTDHAEESSDMSIDEQSTLIELLQKLRKVDPETLILNLNQIGDEGDCESQEESGIGNGISIDDVSSRKQSKQADHKEEQAEEIFVYAAYVPPGKHLILVRDQGTDASHEQDPFKEGRSIRQSSHRNSQRESSRALPSNRQGNQHPAEATLELDAQTEKSKKWYWGLRRAKLIRENASEYFMKELIIEPRQNVVMKTYAKPFQLAKMPQSDLTEPVLLESGENEAEASDLANHSVFHSWLEETEKTRKIFFNDHIMAPLQSQMTCEIEQNTDFGSPHTEFLKSQMKQQPKIPLAFSSLDNQENTIKQIFWDNFKELRELFIELAALDAYTYPLVSMNVFAKLCLAKGQGYLKAQLRPEIEKPQVVAPVFRRRSSVLKTQEKPEQPPPSELYFEDINQPISKNQNRVPGEITQGQHGQLMVEQVGFFAHLIKISLTWSNGDPSGLKATHVILKKICEVDVPILRSELAVQHNTVAQMCQDEQLLLSSQFRHKRLFNDERVNNILKVFQRPLIALFMSLAGRNPQNLFEFEQCLLVQASMPLSSFRAKKVTRRTPLKAVIKAFVATKGPSNEPQIPQPVLQLETIQLCFAKSKSLQPEQRLDTSGKSQKQPIMNKLKGSLRNMKLILPQYLKNLDDRSDEKLAAISAKQIDFRHLTFVEWLEFLCRLTTSVFTVDAKVAAKTRSPTILNLVQVGRQPLAEQLATFLCTFLEKLLIEHTKRRVISTQSMQEREMKRLEDIYDQIPIDPSAVMNQMND